MRLTANGSMSGSRMKSTASQHHGENPLSVAADAAQKSTEAVKEAEAAAPGIAADAKPEYERIVNDMRAIQYLMAYYNAKVQAAALVMRYGYDHDMCASRRGAHAARAECRRIRKTDQINR